MAAIPHENWLQDYITTYVQRDVRQITQVTDLGAFTGFVRLCAGHTGQELNLSQIGADAGISHNTAKAWLAVLEASYLVVRVPAWHRNINKRTVKRPKLHFVDTGLVCALLGIRSAEQLATYPLRGAIFESFVAMEIHKWRLNRGLAGDLHYYREIRGAQVDVLVPGHPKGYLVECKSGQTVQPEFFGGLAGFDSSEWTKRLVYGGEQEQLRSDVHVLPWQALAAAVWS